jgi:twinkle protein
MSEFEYHAPCPECGSSDGVGVYSDGHGHCFVCNEYYDYIDGHNKNKSRGESTIEQPTQKQKFTKPLTPLTDVFRAIPRRGLPEEAIKKFGIDVNMDKTQDVAHRYPYFVDGVHVANKVRKRTEKTFYWEGDNKNVGLFGEHLFPAGGKYITVTEGELDAPSAWVLMGSRYPVVSVINGSGGAVNDCKARFEYLDSFEEIVVCFDKDDCKVRPDGTKFYPGQEAAKKVAELFKPGKVRILELSEGKDPNDYRQKGIDPKKFVDEWWRAPKFKPDGLIPGTDMWDRIVNRPSHFCTPYPFGGLNNLTYGIRLSEFVVINAPTGVGKTSLLKEIEYAILTNPEVREKEYGIGFLHLEELDSDLALGLMSVHANKRFNLPDVEYSQDELRNAYDEIINTNRVVIYDHFGSNEIDSIVAKVRHMAALGCKYIVLDHLSIVVSDQSGDERKQLDEISTKLKTLCMEANIALIAVIHQNRQGQIRGTAGVEQLANIILRLERDLVSPDPWRRNVTKVWVEKNRFCGRTGPASWLFFNDITGRMEELNDVAVTKYEEGLSINDADVPF